jgi:hypothetical protein
MTVDPQTQFAFDRKIGRTEYSSTGAVLGQEAYVHQGDEVMAILDGSPKMRRAILHGPEVDQVFAEETFTATGVQVRGCVDSLRDCIASVCVK